MGNIVEGIVDKAKKDKQAYDAFMDSVQEGDVIQDPDSLDWMAL